MQTENEYKIVKNWVFINNYSLWRYRLTSKTPEMTNNVEEYWIMVFNNSEKLYAESDLWYYYSKLLYAPNAYHGYHNFRHMMHVTCETYDACKCMQVDPETFLVMLLAAIFHDYGHTGDGKVPDYVNIQIALTNLKVHIHPKHSFLIPKIMPFIEATEFPHKMIMPNGNPQYHELLLALRDADMSQSLFSVWQQQTIFGMGSEQHKSREEMLRGQLPFLKDILRFHSEWGKQRFNPMKEVRIAEVEFINEKIFHTNYYS